MKVYLIIVAILLINIIKSNAQNSDEKSILTFLKNDDINGLLVSNNNNYDNVITSLASISFPDTIFDSRKEWNHYYDEIWYDFRLIYPESVIIEADFGIKYAVSLKLKALYWIYLITMNQFDTIYDNSQYRIVFYKDSTINTNNRFFVDYKYYYYDYTLENAHRYLRVVSQIIDGERKYEVGARKYIKENNENIIELMESFNNWMSIYKQYGIKYMQTNNICLFEDVYFLNPSLKNSD